MTDDDLEWCIQYARRWPTTMTTEAQGKKLEDVIRRIRALKTKANDKGVTEAEAAAFTAKAAEMLAEYGLAEAQLRPWHGRVWLNPPYSSEAARWLARLAQHGDGVALIFARTETESFFENVWMRATACLFLRGRLCFHYVDGSKAKSSAGAPSVLVAYGRKNATQLYGCGLPGHYVSVDRPQTDNSEDWGDMWKKPYTGPMSSGETE